MVLAASIFRAIPLLTDEFALVSSALDPVFCNERKINNVGNGNENKEMIIVLSCTTDTHEKEKKRHITSN